ncbi:MAG: hypothetical protein IE931_08120 [Sphingobacteriales bacterium]|nr:hypothetical protein [Sphingobacteriales bacterium]
MIEEANEDLPVSGANWAYNTTITIERFIANIWCGAKRFLHTKVTKQDTVLGHIFGWKSSLGEDTFKRFFSKFDYAKKQLISNYFYI